MKKFPLYQNHDVASCFNCGGDFYGEYYSRSGFAHGDGEYQCHCVKCSMWTYYDVDKKNTGPCKSFSLDTQTKGKYLTRKRRAK